MNMDVYLPPVQFCHRSVGYHQFLLSQQGRIAQWFQLIMKLIHQSVQNLFRGRRGQPKIKYIKIG